MNINPTSAMFAAVVFAFLFYITVRGDLAKWLGLLGLAPNKTAAGMPAPLAGSPATLNPDLAQQIMKGLQPLQGLPVSQGLG